MADKYLQNEDWVRRMQERFVHLDTNKNGYLEMADWELWMKNIEKATNATPDLISKVRQAVHEFCAGIGITEGKRLSKEDFITAFAAFAVAERARKESGEEPLLHKLYNAYYDVVDVNKDGYVTLAEFRTVMKACNYDVQTINATFTRIDADISGKIERKELNDYEFELWFRLEDPK